MFIILFFISFSAFSQSTEKKLQTILDSIYNTNKNTIGILVHVESPKNNISWSAAVGISNKVTNKALEKDQPVLIASCIKTYVSATILKLQEQGKLSIEDNVKKHLTQKTKKLFKSDGYNLRKIKIKHLLSHTSGIDNYVNEDYIEFIDENPQYQWTRAKQLQLAIDVGKPLGKPGTVFKYADTNYLLCTEIIESVTKKPFFIAMKNLLGYDELNFKNTWFPTLEKKPKYAKDLANQYWTEKNWDASNMNISFDLYGGGGIATNTKESAQFLYALFNNKIIKNDSVKNLLFTDFKTNKGSNYPYYLGIIGTKYQNLDSYGHGGFWGTLIRYFPQIDTSISVFVLDRNERRMRKVIYDEIINVLKKDISQ